MNNKQRWLSIAILSLVGITLIINIISFFNHPDYFFAGLIGFGFAFLFLYSLQIIITLGSDRLFDVMVNYINAQEEYIKKLRTKLNPHEEKKDG